MINMVFKIKKELVVSLFVLTACNVFAQNNYQWKTGTANGYTYRYVTDDPMKTRFYTLKNGMTVILSPNHKEPRISFRMAVRSGSNSDPRNHTGLAHYLEHLLFKGTNKYGSLNWENEKPILDKIEVLYEQYNSTTDVEKRKEIYKEIDRLSGEAAKQAIAGEYDKMMKSIGSQGTNAHTSVEETVYEEDIPANALDKLLAIQAERFRYPVLRIFHTELEAVYEEKNRGLDNDNNKMQEATFSTVFPTHNYGVQSTIGTVEHLKNPSIKAIRNFYKNNYVPNNMAVIMAGDFNPDELVIKIDKAFAYMQPKPVDEYKGPEEAPIAGPVVKEVYGPAAEQIRILFRTAAAGSREAFLAGLISAILSNGNAGLMDLNLVKQQKVSGAQSGVWQYKDYGIFLVIGVPKQGQSLEDLKLLLLEQISILKSGQFDESLIKAIAANSKLSLLKGLESNSNRVQGMVDEFIKNKGTGWDKSVAEIDEMGKVTKIELVDFANKFFQDNNYVLLYKRKGEDKNIEKVEKPAITPVETNTGKISPFVQTIIAEPLPSFKPVWLDYNRDIQKSKAGNAEVIYVKNKDNSLFTLTYNFDMGSWNNKLLPVAAQYLRYIGTNKYGTAEISKEFYKLACSFNITVGNEQTIIVISGLEENYKKAVQLFEELIANCNPDEKALEGLKGLLQKSRDDKKLNKGAIAQGLQSYAYYGAQNPFNYSLSNTELKNLNAKELTDLLHSLNNYRHKITYYGPQQLNEFATNISAIHTMPSVWKSNDSAVKFSPALQTENRVLFANYNAVQAEIYWSRNLGKYDPKLEALINVFTNYFGGGMGSVVFNVIRESKALAYATYAGVRTPVKREDNFTATAYIGCQADKIYEAIDGMNALLNEMPVAEQGFENVKSSLGKDIETERITGRAIIDNYLGALKKGLNYDIRKANYEEYKKIRFGDIAMFQKQQLSNQPYTYSIVGAEKKINLETLKKYGTLKVLTLEEIFGY